VLVIQGRLTYRGPLELQTVTQLQMLCEILIKDTLAEAFCPQTTWTWLPALLFLHWIWLHTYRAAQTRSPPSCIHELPTCHLAGGPRRLNLWLNLALLLNACVCLFVCCLFVCLFVGGGCVGGRYCQNF